MAPRLPKPKRVIRKPSSGTPSASNNNNNSSNNSSNNNNNNPFADDSNRSDDGNDDDDEGDDVFHNADALSSSRKNYTTNSSSNAAATTITTTTTTISSSSASKVKKFTSKAGKFAKKGFPVYHSSPGNGNANRGDGSDSGGRSGEGSSPGGAGGGGGSGGGLDGLGASNRARASKNPFETSEGAMRLNRILDQKNAAGGGCGGNAAVGRSGGNPSGGGGGVVPSPGAIGRSKSDGGGVDAAAGDRAGGDPPSSPSATSFRNVASSNAILSGGGGNHHSKQLFPDYVPPSTVQLSDPADETAVGEMTCRISAKQRVDSRSIGGMIVAGDGKVEARTGNVLLRDGWEDLLAAEDGTSAAPVEAAAGEAKAQGPRLQGTSRRTSLRNAIARPMNRLTNECLFSMCVSQFDLSVGLTGGPSGGKKRHIPIAKTRNKLRYIVILRSTNRPLLRPKPLGKKGVEGGGGLGNRGGSVGEDDEFDDDDDDDDLGSDDGYDNMYNPEQSEAGSSIKPAASKKGRRKSVNEGGSDAGPEDGKKATPKRYEEYDCGIPPEREISSFPAILCMAIHADGTKPDVRKILELDKLVSIENAPPRKNDSTGSAGNVILVFRNGDAVEIDCDLPNAVMHSIGAGVGGGGGHGAISGLKKKNSDSQNRLRKEKFLWSLLQIHAILCTAVVERTAAAAALARPGSVLATSQLPPLVVRNVDRAELQYISTVNGFLTDSPVLCALLDRQSKQRNRNRGMLAAGGGNAEEKKSDDIVEEGKDEMDGMAYDMMMGNYNRIALFVNEEEKRDAADVLNSTPWQQQEITSEGTMNVDASATAETLVRLLQQRMRDLEAETCRRLISWEDEKFYSALGGRSEGNATDEGNDNTVDAMSLNDLFKTLQRLDDELEKMESWIQDRAATIKPITDECHGIEEENRMLEQQWISYEALGNELKRLLGGLVLPQSLMKVLENPGSVIVYDRSGAIDVERSEEGVELIHQAGQALKVAIDAAETEGGIHLRAVSDTVKTLSATSTKFCGSLARIVVTVMEQLSKEVCSNSDSMVGKNDNHSIIARKIREAQRSFQASLLSYIKLIEILALLKPDILPAVRDAYSELVAEGIMSKKRMKAYFASLPGRTSVKLAHDDKFDALPGRSSASVTHDLSEYPPVSLRSSNPPEASAMMKPVNVEDIEAALAEMLPLIAREAYFTAALFGLSSRHLDGRQKKRNFEAAKKSVDNSSQYFRYYMTRICGIASEMDAEGKKVKGDAMLSLVASIHLNESMDGYIDRHKKGGDHSLSLAYVRATILDLRKKVDKQWVIWVEDQIKWIRSNPGVPLNGKRAGIFASVARFPSYLDHVFICCKAGRSKDHSPNLAKIKVVSYYLQKMASALFASLNECAERETTDQQYASNVMRMENSYFFTQSIKQRGPDATDLFQKQITGASAICKQSTDAYLGWMIKREFKAMHSLFSNISRIRKDVGDADVPIHVPRAQFVRTLQKESSREIMKEKIGVVYARMEKHLSESGGLLPVAWKALVKVLYEWFGRWEKLSTSCYKFILEPSAIDVVRIAKAASGVAMAPSNRKGVSESRAKNQSASIEI
eukprot:CAMPEP_0171427684 /NCGR_PEP_ID=MMETSP0881-20121228/4770_1 /TAXON_ID=67004 /ORGANISM="Thalassiosira weissflogii, Strain CCMP1336" /LENGTH=1579 /DNA_ID=CAMNT_0011947393 /DNA_START=177 /DNA_END=4916 /DNA_ORIENTATION=-